MKSDLRILLLSIAIMLILISVIICVAGCSSVWNEMSPERSDIHDAYKAVADDIEKVYEGDYLIILTEAYAKSTVYPDSKFYYGQIFYVDTEDIEDVFVRIEPDGTISVFD